MKQTVSQTNQITLDSIAEHCRYEFDIRKGTFEQEIFHAGGWLSRIRRGKSKMDELHYQQLFNLLREHSDEPIAVLLKRWFPSLHSCDDESSVCAAVRASLDGENQAGPNPRNPAKMNSLDFVRRCMQYHAPIKRIRMAFHLGWLWHYEDEREKLLTGLARDNVEIQVIANCETPTMLKIIDTMYDPDKELRYIGMTRSLEKWHDYENAYPSIHLRIAEYPILHQSVIVEYEDGFADMTIRDYAYGSPVTGQSPKKYIDCNMPEFTYYTKEFDFLWEKSQCYPKWHENLPKPDEIMPQGEWVLICPPQEWSSGRWTYSVLTIQKENRVALRPCVTENLNESCDYEHDYHGSLKLTRKNIFISLHDASQQEYVTISLVRPTHLGDRFIGIMTRPSPTGQPTAFKCVCVTRSLLPRLHDQTLSFLLGHHNKDWSDDLLVIENRDIIQFDSDRILNEKV